MKFNIIVVGGGHAGIEASYIASKMGLSVLMVTSHLDMIGHMSCNPAIGGIAKGTIVREIDALGGLMARIADKAGIHFRMLNKSKGMAVWGNRAQEDRKLYRHYAKEEIEKSPGISLFQGFVLSIKEKGGKAKSVIVDSGEEIEAAAIILTMGTFLNGLIHIGLQSSPSGRLGEPPSLGLTENIISYGIKAGRLKTGTSPRIDGRTLNKKKLQIQSGDESPWPFSYATEEVPENKIECLASRTNIKTHQIIRENLDRSPLYTGIIKSTGPRYCPSIEDKVVRFGDRDGHALFLEPEGLDTQEMYLNGLATSLPFDVQIKMVQSISGLEKAKIVRPGYGIEYDFFKPTQLLPTLESKIIKNLFFAGQINGTSGYEEAAGQGVVAGINAGANIIGQDPVILSRDSSYIGVLIDDLVTKGTEEPYRMFTSRAEYRLLLRQDNADERLMPLAAARNIVDLPVYEKRRRLWDEKKRWMDKLGELKITADMAAKTEKDISMKASVKGIDFLKRPQVTLDDILSVLDEEIMDRDLKARIEADIKYSGFVQKQIDEVKRLKKMDNVKIPLSIDYSAISGLLSASKTTLAQVKPVSLGQASRIPGVTPSDITVLMIYLAKHVSENVSRETV
ncbi:MAG: tRNA uridine-5-carboxymethylaminomethyl(34) synthesis enzyme MnmG [Chitinivibrionales bacterium]|nr:tRNA uridine-5-carboxymethylaminomethyl(34) synthesis enzyme MnmG [Chitinivibrionales bacterium]